MTTRTAKRLEELKYMLLNGQIINEQGIFAEGEIQSIINFKNELKDNINIIETKDSIILSPDKKFKINCRCQFCIWVNELIREIESLEVR